MDAIQIRGGSPLFGETKIQGSKNAVLPVMAAALLIEGTSVIENCPKITDVFHMQKLLEDIGCKIRWRDRSLYIDAAHVTVNTMSGESVTGMRSSIMLLGAMLGRFGKAAMNHPGGCVIGKRPIDIHLTALAQMGVVIREEDCFFTAAADRLTGNLIELSFPSVGATENVLLAAVMAKGVTVLKNAAGEPEITALCDFLKAAGAIIESDRCFGGNTLIIRGGQKLYPICFRIPTDRIVAGTYLLTVLGTGGHIFLADAPVEHMSALIGLAEAMAAEISIGEKGIAVLAEGVPKHVPYLETGVYPHFPTDLQSPLLAVLTRAGGESMISEKIFENRMRIVPELLKMGADIKVQENTALVTGVDFLVGTKVQARELRGGAALVLAGCMAEGETMVENRHFIERGYEDIVRDYQNLGVKINPA